MGIFRIYNDNGSIAFDNSTSVFGLIKSGTLSRFNGADSSSNKRDMYLKFIKDPSVVDMYIRQERLYWRANRNSAKDFYDISLKNVQYRDNQGRQQTGDFLPLRHALSKYDDSTIYPEKRYYIDVMCEGVPMAFLSVDKQKPKYSGVLFDDAYDESPFLGLSYLHTQKTSANTHRIVFASAMPLSDKELSSFRVYVFGKSQTRASSVGLNLYDRQGNLTFSSNNMPLKVFNKSLTPSKSVSDNKVFLDKDGFVSNLLGDYAFCELDSTRRYACLSGGITDLFDPIPLNQPNRQINLSAREALGIKLHYGVNHDWDWYSTPQFGVCGGMGFIGAYLGSAYYAYALRDRRYFAKRFEFEWDNANKTQVDILVADVSHLPFPFN